MELNEFIVLSPECLSCDFWMARARSFIQPIEVRRTRTARSSLRNADSPFNRGESTSSSGNIVSSAESPLGDSKNGAISLCQRWFTG